MRSVSNPGILGILLCLLVPAIGSAQDSLFLFHFKSDSLLQKKIHNVFASADTKISAAMPAIAVPPIDLSSKSFFKTGSGYISYNWAYRSGNDSSLIDNNVGQHVITGSFNATIAQLVPVRITYFERQSNSPYFRDFRDVTIDVDVQRYRQMQTQKALNGLKGNFRNIQDPKLPNSIKATAQKLEQYKNFLNDPSIISELIRSRETLIRTGFADTSLSYKDSMISRAKKFVSIYDTIQARQEKYSHLKDSLNEVYNTVLKKVRRIEPLINGRPVSTQELQQLSELYGKEDKNIRRLRKAYSGIRKLTLGRTYPNFTNLTLQNVNVNGINLEYARGNYYVAVSAGLVDFRIRDFLFSQQRLSKQYVFASRIGYGHMESDHIILTYFRGRKQLFGGNLQQPSNEVQGISLYGQFFINKQIRVYGEIAQSGVPYALGGNNSPKPALAFNDNSQRAYALGFFAVIPQTQTTVDGYFQHTGLNYQNFNSFQYNAISTSWSFRGEQFLFKRQLALQASFRKNDFLNPLVLQRYNANTVYKSVTASFKRQQWPLLTIGYIPASQYTMVGNQVYENHYQTFMGTVSHQYKIGIAKGSTLFSFSRFFNDNRDSNLVYFNSTNFFGGQTFFFNRFTASINVSGMSNGRHKMVVMEESLSATFLKVIHAGFGIKINNLNRTMNKIGFNTKLRTTIKNIGEVNVWVEQSYLPALQQEFYRYEAYNIRLIRYFK